MKWWRIVGALLVVTSLLIGWQRPFREYPGVEYDGGVALPSDWQEKTEWAFVRLMFPGGPLDGYRGRFDGDWREGMTLWTQDYPKADRQRSEERRVGKECRS